jgi:hypothetical protein
MMKRLFDGLVLAALSHSAQQAPPKPVVLIGGADNHGAELGAFRSITILPSLLVVTEGSAPFVKVFNHQGKLVQSFGHAGAGPGEFRAPGAVTYDSVNRIVWIADARLGRIGQYRVTDTLTLAAERVSAVNVRNLCAMNGRLFASSPLGGHLVHELAVESGRFVARQSYGALESKHPQAATTMVKSLISAGPMYCDALHNAIYHASSDLGEIHRVDLATGLQTTTSVRGFVGLTIAPTGENSVTFDGPARGWADQIAALVPTAAGVAIVITPNGAAKNHPPAEVSTLSLTGVESARVPYQWLPVGSARGLVVCTTMEPAPTIAYFARPRCP